MREPWVVDTDGINFYVCLRDDRVFVARKGTHSNFADAKAHADSLNSSWRKAQTND